MRVQLPLSLQIRNLSNQRLFGRPGHGAPTENVRKKKFTEHQLMTDAMGATRQQQQDPNWTASAVTVNGRPAAAAPQREHHQVRDKGIITEN